MRKKRLVIDPAPKKAKNNLKERKSRKAAAPVDLELLDKILLDIEGGSPVDIAFIGNGAENKLERWLKYETVRVKIKHSEAKSVLTFWRKFAESAKKDASLSRELLGCRWPESFGKASVTVRDPYNKKGKK